MSYAFPLLTSTLFSPCWLLLGERVSEWISKSLFRLESVDEWRGKGVYWDECVCGWSLTEVLVYARPFVWLLDLLTESKFWYLWYRQINFLCLVSLFLVLHLTATVLALSLCQACNFIVLWVNKQKWEKQCFMLSFRGCMVVIQQRLLFVSVAGRLKVLVKFDALWFLWCNSAPRCVSFWIIKR